MPITKENDKPISIAFKDAAIIRRLKQKDYGSIEVYFPFGHKSFMQEINKKTLRLVNLVNHTAGVVPKNESIEDNLLDLLNYASFYYEWRKGVLDD